MSNHSGEKKPIQKSNVIFLSNIPPNKNDVHEVFKHFKHYGRIQSIWAEGTKATIVYETPEMAEAAFNSPEAFVGNRFVRYFYHKKPEEAESSLSKIVDKDRVNAALKEAKQQIANAQKDTIMLQSQISSQNLINTKKEIEDLLKEVKLKLISETNPESRAEYENDLQSLEEMLQSIEKDISQKENTNNTE
ncbi:RNA-binding protein 26-like [Histomonas meleagridis]|uniref:RNA-binding protein 26-like n=1 Tax=Histomonas meleagridis TaxID=135588 RepID=UPI00355A0170|nr:RNA-binding protein 26-like [Histomonas meleagridis]KAH0802692.1 RNA-binding protein 26-like [Histomonas meleagridis]